MNSVGRNGPTSIDMSVAIDYWEHISSCELSLTDFQAIVYGARGLIGGSSFFRFGTEPITPKGTIHLYLGDVESLLNHQLKFEIYNDLDIESEDALTLKKNSVIMPLHKLI